MRLEKAVVISQRMVCANTHLMWLSCPPLARGAAPGRFLMIQCGEGQDLLLPRPMSYHRFRTKDGERQFAIFYDIRGRGTAWLSGRRTGDEIRVFGPLGQGFSVNASAHNLLLVAGGIGVAAMPALFDEALAMGKAVLLLQGARTATKLLPSELVPDEVEIAFATDDGSTGCHGSVTKLFSEHLPWADQGFACGPPSMFEAMADVMRERQSEKSVQILMEERMGCGTAVCYGCAIFTRRGVRLVCKDGPQFELRQIFSR